MTAHEAREAVRRAHAGFEVNSGWAPPDEDTLAEWVADGVCRCPDECLVAPDAWCQHGLASWQLILSDEALDVGFVLPHDRPAAAPPVVAGAADAAGEHEDQQHD